MEGDERYPERLRRDIEAYRRVPQTEEERAFGSLPVRLDLGDDEVDYDALYGTEVPLVLDTPTLAGDARG